MPPLSYWEAAKNQNLRRSQEGPIAHLAGGIRRKGGPARLPLQDKIRIGHSRRGPMMRCRSFGLRRDLMRGSAGYAVQRAAAWNASAFLSPWTQAMRKRPPPRRRTMYRRVPALFPSPARPPFWMAAGCGRLVKSPLPSLPENGRGIPYRSARSPQAHPPRRRPDSIQADSRSLLWMIWSLGRV